MLNKPNLSNFSKVFYILTVLWIKYSDHKIQVIIMKHYRDKCLNPNKHMNNKLP
jgi:hypothetical protein